MICLDMVFQSSAVPPQCSAPVHPSSTLAGSFSSCANGERRLVHPMGTVEGPGVPHCNPARPISNCICIYHQACTPRSHCNDSGKCPTHRPHLCTHDNNCTPLNRTCRDRCSVPDRCHPNTPDLATLYCTHTRHCSCRTVHDSSNRLGNASHCSLPTYGVHRTCIALSRCCTLRGMSNSRNAAWSSQCLSTEFHMRN